MGIDNEAELEHFLDSALDGDTSAVRSALAAKMPVDAHTSNGRTALMMACMNGHAECVQILLAHGAQMDPLVDGASPALHSAVNDLPDNRAVIRLLIAHGAKIDVQDGIGNTALIDAALKGQTANVQELLLSGASMGIKNNMGESALSSAVFNNHLPAVKLLLEAGADPEICEPGELTPLMIAAAWGYTDVMLSLVHAGARLDAIDSQGYTAAHGAAAYEMTDAVKLLSQLGCSLSIRNNRGELPSDVAARTFGKRSEIAVLLRQLEAEQNPPAE
jgi:ankyrin repeat protein